MSPTPDGFPLPHSSDFQIMLRQHIRYELDLQHSLRMRKYKAAAWIIGIFFGVILAITCATVLTDVVEHWLFGR